MLEGSQLITENGTHGMPQLSKSTGCCGAFVRLLIRVDKRNIAKRVGVSGGNMCLGAVNTVSTC